MAFNTTKLRGRIYEKFQSQRAFSDAVGEDNSRVSQYFRGKRILTQDTIGKWAEALQIEASSIGDYFFSKEV